MRDRVTEECPTLFRGTWKWINQHSISCSMLKNDAKLLIVEVEIVDSKKHTTVPSNEVIESSEFD